MPGSLGHKPRFSLIYHHLSKVSNRKFGLMEVTLGICYDHQPSHNVLLAFSSDYLLLVMYQTSCVFIRFSCRNPLLNLNSLEAGGEVEEDPEALGTIPNQRIGGLVIHLK